MSVKDQFIEPKPAKIVERVKEKGVEKAAETAGELTEFGVGTAKDEINKVTSSSAVTSALSSAGGLVSAIVEAANTVKGEYNNAKEQLPDEAQKALSEVEDYAEQKAKEKAEEEKKAMQEMVEQKVSDIIQETGLGPEDSEKIIALAKDGCPSEDAKGMVSDATKKALS